MPLVSSGFHPVTLTRLECGVLVVEEDRSAGKTTVSEALAGTAGQPSRDVAIRDENEDLDHGIELVKVDRGGRFKILVRECRMLQMPKSKPLPVKIDVLPDEEI